MITRNEQIALLQRQQELPDLVWIERPTLLHARATEAGVCPCGCGSQSGEEPDQWAAMLIETTPGPVLVIDRASGTRKYRDRSANGELRSPEERAKFDALRAHCEVVCLPRRAYAEQLVAIEARPKVKGVFGGVRAGKTECLAEEAVDAWIEVGGPGVVLWWVAPQLADTLRGIEKLITGKTIRGGVTPEVRPPKLPLCLVADYPSGAKERKLEQIKRRKPITLFDGTTIELRYANAGRGAPLKGDNVPWIGVDEGAEVKDAEAWTIMIQRTTDAGGSVSTATTPVAGSPLKHLVYDQGDNLHDNPEAKLTGWCHLTMMGNPWVRPAEVEIQRLTTLRQEHGEEKWQRDGMGKWIIPGQVMWDYFREERHVVVGPWRYVHKSYQVDGRPLIDITARAGATFFDDSDSDLSKGLGGQDFNERGHFTEILRIAHPEGTDPDDQENWVVLFIDEVRKKGDAWAAAQWLGKCGRVRGETVANDIYANLAISCDATGAQFRVPETNVVNIRESSIKAEDFVRAGHDCRPCNVSAKGKPVNPGKYEQCALMHMLQRDRADQHPDDYPDGIALEGAPPRVRFLVHKQFCPELVKSLREQVKTDRGVPYKRSDTLSDRLSDPIDAGLYIIWALLSDEHFDQGVELDYG